MRTSGRRGGFWPAAPIRLGYDPENARALLWCRALTKRLGLAKNFSRTFCEMPDPKLFVL